jgi:ATP-dependent exoDNAse (exonuclease V) alpha subunit
VGASLNFTEKQKAGLEMVGRFRKSSDRLAILTGYAGTGKTTLLKTVAQALSSHSIPVQLLAPTGKAALRLREVTGQTAQTVHRCMYSPRQDEETGEVSFLPRGVKELEELRGSMVIVDEASMLSRRVWEHLALASAAVDLKVLLVGDTFQLEPVEAEGGFSALALETPHRVHLDEVVRQALDSPVLRAATAIRAAKGPMDVARALRDLPTLGGRTPVDLILEDPSRPVLVHRNATRHSINAEVRRRRELPEGQVVQGEPLLVLRNCYDLDRYNGEVVTLDGWPDGTPRVVEAAVRDRQRNVSRNHRYTIGTMSGEKDQAFGLCLDQVAGTTDFADFWLLAGYRDAWGRGLRQLPEHLQVWDVDEKTGQTYQAKAPLLMANYGYCLTGHKSQGSEWREVVVVVEPTVKTHEVAGRRHLYTCITRAREQAYWTFMD